MSEKTSGSFSIDTYMAKQEGLLLEHIRRMLQAETKITLLESAIQDMFKRNEDLSQQVETGKVALEQAINGLSAVTVERNDLMTKVSTLESALVTSRADLNKALIDKTEVEKLKSRLNTLEADYETLKANYNLVLEQYNAAVPAVIEEAPPEPVSLPEKKKRPKSVESEWVDGKY